MSFADAAGPVDASLPGRPFLQNVRSPLRSLHATATREWMANPTPTAAETFGNIARDRRALCSFLAGIGNERAPSRVRAAEFFHDCETVVDVGSGPCVSYQTLRESRAGVGASPGVDGDPDAPLRYVGVEPVADLAALACAQQGLRPVSPSNGTLPPLADVIAANGSSVVHAPNVAGFLATGARSADGVLVRHVLEHLPAADACVLLAIASAVARRKLFVAISAATRVDGLSRSLVTDTFLGAWRWSHWRPALLRELGLDRDGKPIGEATHWRLVAHERRGFAANEEVFEFERIER